MGFEKPVFRKPIGLVIIQLYSNVKIFLVIPDLTLSFDATSSVNRTLMGIFTFGE